MLTLQDSGGGDPTRCSLDTTMAIHPALHACASQVPRLPDVPHDHRNEKFSHRARRHQLILTAPARLSMHPGQTLTLQQWDMSLPAPRTSPPLAVLKGGMALGSPLRVSLPTPSLRLRARGHLNLGSAMRPPTWPPTAPARVAQERQTSPWHRLQAASPPRTR